MNYAHIPVLQNETLNLLGPRGQNELMIDANTGEGGHSYNFLSKFPGLSMICIDADKEILAIAQKRLEEFKDRVKFYAGWSFDFFKEYMSKEAKRPDTILFDLGVSLFHYKASGRGFSFDKDEFLDMRIDTSCGITAAQIIASYSEKELADLFYNNADERFSRRIAARIVNERKNGKITTTKALADLVESAVPASYPHGRRAAGTPNKISIHAATKTFQALRIAVNGELSQLHALLEEALRVLEPGGRLGVISFHSLEDRIVKNFFRTMNKDCICPENVPICKCKGCRRVDILTKKGIAAENEEIKRNPPSRSARLRVVEKTKEKAEQ